MSMPPPTIEEMQHPLDEGTYSDPDYFPDPEETSVSFLNFSLVFSVLPNFFLRNTNSSCVVLDMILSHYQSWFECYFSLYD